MTTDQLRKTYLDFFKSKAHKVFSSDSLVPTDDPSLLFTGAGMNQFKSYFLGLKKDVRRATSCQKCLRTADLERVGKTAYHHSFFEMLGNFSFGDYFKEEAIAWGWEFVTQELKLPKEKLWVSVYEEDEEAFQIWKNKIRVPEARIVRMGAVDNFWPSNAKVDGPNGPCGPCSEIYVGETPGKGVEIWNLVFTQFDRQSDGSLLPLPQKNIDTGMGLERTSAVLQDVSNNFDIDIFKEIRAGVKKLLKKDLAQPAHENAAMDHIRAVIFCIADGALPSNEGRGYVVRKLIRLGTDHLMKAGAEGGSFCRLVPVVVSVMSAAYPELASREKNISTIIENEERSYLEVLRTQLPKLAASVLEIKNKNLGADALCAEAAELAFKYYDTYGVPFDSIWECLEKNHLKMDAARLNQQFDALLEAQKKRSRESSKITGEIFSKNDALLHIQDLSPTKFMGYETGECEGRLLRTVGEGLLIFDRTPFYAEAGGQVGDTGWITGKHFKAKVLDTQWLEKCILHKVSVEEGKIAEGECAVLKIDAARRLAIMKNHTATHLLHSALRKTLGSHVKQSGSLVAPDRLRFDFTHFSALDADTIEKVENLVNDEIQKKIHLNKKVMTKETALKEGAVAFFGEKYGDEVRVVTIGDFSKELCGGTHLESTAEIGLFKVVSESSIQAGVRRIEAVTAERALQIIAERQQEITAIAGTFGVPEDGLLLGLEKIKTRVSETRNRLLSVMGLKIREKVSGIFANAETIKGVRITTCEISGVDVDLLQKSVEHLKTLNQPFVALLCSVGPDKISFVVAASQGVASKGFHSGNLVKQMAQIVGGNGGGRPDFAVGGGKDIAKKGEALGFGKNQTQKFLNESY